MEKNKVGFKLIDITIEEFAVIKESFPSKDDKISISLATNVKIDPDKHVIGVFTKFQFFNQNSPFMISEIGCHFKLKKENWEEFLNEDGTITFHKNFMSHLLVLTVDTSRGVIHAKRPDELRGLILPTLDVSKHFPEDLTLSIRDEE